MKPRILLVPLLVFSVCAIYGQAGLKPDSASLNAMEKIQFLTGNWKGTGWIQMGKERHQFDQHETVAQKINGSVLVIDGLGKDSATGEIVHQALAVISYDLATGKYVIRAFRGDGNSVDADGLVEENGSFVWGFSLPQQGEVKYTIHPVDGRWVEKGEFSQDGSNWFQFLGMDLKKE